MNEQHTYNGATIRAIRADDLPELLTLNKYGLTAAGIDVADDYYAGSDFADLDATYGPEARGLMLAAEVDGKIVAMGGIKRIDDGTCELLRMRVYPQYQRRGYGSTILARLEDAARTYGYRTIELITGEAQKPAISLYLARNYQITQHETIIGIPSVHMRKHL